MTNVKQSLVAAGTPQLFRDTRRLKPVEKKWVFQFDGEEGECPDSAGIFYYARILSEPHKTISAVMLSLMRSKHRGSGRSLDTAEGIELKEEPQHASRQEMMDEQYLLEIARCLNEFTSEIEAAKSMQDFTMIDVLTKEKEKILARFHECTKTPRCVEEFLKEMPDDLSQWLALHGRALMGGDHQEKARSAVGHALHRARAKLAAASGASQALAHYLQQFVKGHRKSFIYEPEPDAPVWDINYFSPASQTKGNSSRLAS